MPSDTAVCETCGDSSYHNEDPETGMLWCRTCDAWRWFKWPRTGERYIRDVAPAHRPRRDGFPKK